MKPADTRLRHSLNLLSKFRPFLIVCIALLSIPIAAYLNSQRPVVSASMPDHLSANSISTNSGSFTLGDQLGEPITVSMGGGMVWNTPFKVPIRVGDLTGKGVRSFVFTCDMNPIV